MLLKLPWLPRQAISLLFTVSRVSSPNYRVTMVVGDMGWVDYDFGHSTVCQVLPRQMGFGRIILVIGHDGGKPKSSSIQPMSPTTIVTLH